VWCFWVLASMQLEGLMAVVISIWSASENAKPCLTCQILGSRVWPRG
jgi:hypothetical protein